MRVLRDQQPQAVTIRAAACGVRQGGRRSRAARDRVAHARAWRGPNSRDLWSLIDARLESGEPDRALRIAQHALAARTAPPPEAIDALIVAHQGRQDQQRALRREHLRIEYGIRLEPSDLGVQTLLSSAAQSPMPLEVLSVRQELMQHCEVIGARETTGHRLLHDELIHRCVEAGKSPSGYGTRAAAGYGGGGGWRGAARWVGRCATGLRRARRRDAPREAPMEPPSAHWTRVCARRGPVVDRRAGRFRRGR